MEKKEKSFKFQGNIDELSNSNQIAESLVMTRDKALLFQLCRISGLLLNGQRYALKAPDSIVSGLMVETAQIVLDDLIIALQEGKPLPGEQTELFKQK